MASKKKDEERISQDIAGRASWDSGGSGYRANDSSGNDYASMAGMSELDRAALDAAGKSWNEANAAGDQAGMDAAHRQAEAIRNRYGYSGGGDGSQYIPTGTPARDFSYETAPSYTSKYQAQIDELTQAILGREPFQYNHLEDPLYQQYQDSYTRAGQRAMQDTLAQVSARTGGLASSYATSASQQAYDNYMSALADKVPELYQLAYSMYMDEGNQLRANLDMLTALENGDYGRYQDLLTQYNNDRNFAYGQYRDLVGDDRYNLEWNYGVGRDQISDQRYEDETAYNREQYENETEYARALERAQTLAQAGDFSGYRALGYSDQEIASLQNAYQRALYASSAGGSSGRSGSGSGGSTSGDTQAGSGDIYSTLYQAGVRTEGDAYAQLLAAGYNTTQAGKLAEYFMQWIDSGGGSGASTVNNVHGYDDDGTLGWVHIPGHGRFSVQELYRLVEDGKVREIEREDGTVSYRWID